MQDFEFGGRRRRRFDIKRIIITLVVVCLVAGIVIFIDHKISKPDNSDGDDKIISATDDSEQVLKAADDADGTDDSDKGDSSKDDAKATKKPAKEDPDKKDETKVTVKPSDKDTVVVAESEAVSDDYFDDALFIGDSRVEGLQLLSGITTGTFYVEKGLTVKKIIEDDIAKVDGKDMTVYEALKKKQFKKIYIKTGINELGWVYSDIFVKDYKKIIKKIKELQPDATIYVQSIIHVSKEESDSSDVFKNEKIDDYNDMILDLVKKTGVYYLDVNEEFTGDDDALIADAASDGIHLKASYCKMWLDYLKTHTVQ